MATPRVLVCDDSALLRSVLRDTLSGAGLHVVGQARDGTELVDAVTRHEPDVVTLDVEMPGMSGVEALRALMAARPTPVVMVSSLTESGAAVTADALAAGAVDAFCKPSGSRGVTGWNGVAGELVRKVRSAAAVSPARLGRRTSTPAVAPRPKALGSTSPLVVIATSTGGPKALASLMPALPAQLGAGVLIVQHMPEGFTAGLAARLDRESRISVREVRGKERIASDRALLAPGGRHLEVIAPGEVRLSDASPVGALKPRADITLETAAKVYRSRLVVAVLTGMGNDGEVGCRAVKQAGGTVLVEDQNSCLVWGMPRAVQEAGLADAALPLEAMAVGIAEAVGR
ncbi:MAG: chemotaxis-specific protein-glutamate methyltransferase CheB [Miltoncostaeaceae bacterium]